MSSYIDDYGQIEQPVADWQHDQQRERDLEWEETEREDARDRLESHL